MAKDYCTVTVHSLAWLGLGETFAAAIMGSRADPSTVSCGAVWGSGGAT